MRVLRPRLWSPFAGVLLQGCALALLAGGAGAGVAGTEYLKPEERTFVASLDQVHSAARAALDRMSIQVQTDSPTKLVGKAGERDVDVSLEWLTSNTTEVRVSVVEKDGVRRDGTMETEIVQQTGRRLPGGSSVSQGSLP
jgi:hypothetical protein